MTRRVPLPRSPGRGMMAGTFPQRGSELMHLLSCERGSEPFLIRELRRSYAHADHRASQPGLVVSNFLLQPEMPPTLVFARQLLPEAVAAKANSISEWSTLLAEHISQRLAPEEPWRLHIVPHYASGAGGENRCDLIQRGVADRLRRTGQHWARTWQESPIPFQERDSLVQLWLCAPDQGYLSLATAPRPWQLRRVLSIFLNGEVAPACDKAAPSRAFAKLVEAENRLGCWISAGEGCVDLGASPGSWSYVALQRGARVLAVDRAPLRPDLMQHPGLTFRQGDGFAYCPAQPVDWLLCDIIATPDRSIELLLRWLRHGWTRRFVVTIKFKGVEEYEQLERLKHALASLCQEFYLMRLTANKNEVCAFGLARKG